MGRCSKAFWNHSCGEILACDPVLMQSGSSFQQFSECLISCVVVRACKGMDCKYVCVRASVCARICVCAHLCVRVYACTHSEMCGVWGWGGGELKRRG